METDSHINDLKLLDNKITKCKKCPRLVEYIRNISEVKVKRFADQKYWAKPLVGFGDPNAKLLIIGLAPAAHGGNRTGRMFTGDSSGDWVAKVLYDNGFATKPTSQSKNDGFALNNAYITAAVRCAPPDNKPTKEELQNCSTHLEKEIQILENITVIVCLGKIAFEACCKILDIHGAKFAHANTFQHKKFTIICSYHPSRQNTQTKRLVWKQWNAVFARAKSLIK